MNNRPTMELLPDIHCACASVRRAARLVTQLYDDEFKGQPEASQYALLSALDQQPGCNQAMLATALGLDKTTLSRNLSVLARKGWIARQEAADRRERGFRLTAAGRGLLQTAKPAWKRAQTRLRSAMTGEQWNQIREAFRVVTDASHKALNQEGRQVMNEGKS
jgi:DNA-binding MarR family transcriptional regulator